MHGWLGTGQFLNQAPDLGTHGQKVVNYERTSHRQGTRLANVIGSGPHLMCSIGKEIGQINPGSYWVPGW